MFDKNRVLSVWFILIFCFSLIKTEKIEIFLKNIKDTPILTDVSIITVTWEDVIESENNYRSAGQWNRSKDTFNFSSYVYSMRAKNILLLALNTRSRDYWKKYAENIV